MRTRNHLSPFLFPILFFGITIVAGTVILHGTVSTAGVISWTDALFTATSATCVTGLTVVDTGSFFNRFGQTVILFLIQIGGLGIMTFTSLIFFLWRKRISLTDRIAVGQSLLHDRSFNLARFLKQLVVGTLLIETAGAALILFLSPGDFTVFSAVFHAVSAFCNAGFSLNRDSLMAWGGHWGVNLVVMGLIISGGIGFSVLVELSACTPAGRLFAKHSGRRHSLSRYARLVLKTTLFLTLFGWIGIYLAEYVGFHRNLSGNQAVLSALFQSVTCRTAGFNTLDIGRMTNVSLLIMMVLMFIGGAPGSCAGGIKVTTFRVLAAFGVAQIRGRGQAEIGKFAADEETLNKALVLLFFSIVIISIATLALNITEGGDVPHPQTRGMNLEIMFEVVSAFGTVGLSTGLTPKLTLTGKWIIIFMMFIGRLGPILFVTAIQDLQKKQRYARPEESLLIG